MAEEKLPAQIFLRLFATKVAQKRGIVWILKIKEHMSRRYLLPCAGYIVRVIMDV